MLYAVRMGALGYAILGEVPKGTQAGHELVNYILKEMFTLEDFDSELPRGYVRIPTLDDTIQRTGLTGEVLRSTQVGYYVEFQELMPKL